VRALPPKPGVPPPYRPRQSAQRKEAEAAKQRRLPRWHIREWGMGISLARFVGQLPL